MGKLTIEQVLRAVERQILFGKTYLGIAKGLLAAEPIVFGGTSPLYGLEENSATVAIRLSADDLREIDSKPPGKFQPTHNLIRLV